MTLKERLEKALKSVPGFSHKSGKINRQVVAAAISETEQVTRQAVKYWLSGETISLDLKYVVAICKLTHVTLDWLVLEKGEMFLKENINDLNNPYEMIHIEKFKNHLKMAMEVDKNAIDENKASADAIIKVALISYRFDNSSQNIDSIIASLLKEEKKD